MTNFMVLYRSTMAANEQVAAGEHLVDFGSPTMPTGDTDPGPAGHPHKAVGTIEVLELLPMPGS